MKYNTNRIWRKHGSQIVFGSLIVVSLLLSYKDIARNMQNLSQARETISRNSTQHLLLEEQLAHEKASAAIAEARYTSGCRIVVAVNSPRNLATLVEGEPVLDRTTKKPLPAGTIVCDSNGNTGVIVQNDQGDLVVGQMAFTGNRELAIAQVRKIRGARVYYVTPEK
jgi:hypothetical protein